MDPVNVLSLYYLEMIKGYRMVGNNVIQFYKKNVLFMSSTVHQNVNND